MLGKHPRLQHCNGSINQRFTGRGPLTPRTGAGPLPCGQMKEFNEMKTLLVTIALGAAVIAAPAMAQAPGGGGGFMQRDETRAEAQQRADMLFRMLDTNFDGTVTRAIASPR